MSIVVQAGMKTNLCGDGWAWNGNSAGMGADGSETGWGRMGMDIKSAGTGGDGSNFCPRAGL